MQIYKNMYNVCHNRKKGHNTVIMQSWNMKAHLKNNPSSCYFVRIPRKGPTEKSVILSQAEFERITSRSRVPTKEERDALREAYQRKKDEEIVGKNSNHVKNVQMEDLQYGSNPFPLM